MSSGSQLVYGKNMTDEHLKDFYSLLLNLREFQFMYDYSFTTEALKQIDPNCRW